MDPIQSTFSIKDLEHFSGIKAHTIRIWEKRYNLFAPNRTEGNQRVYSLESLQKVLNVVLLTQNGMKISKVAQLSQDDFQKAMENLVENHEQPFDYYMHQLKTAMLYFDIPLFEKTYQQIVSEHDFRNLFFDYYIPFLKHIGFLWQTHAISPAHEHFISVLVKQKLLLKIHELQLIPPQNENTQFVLFLPDNEVHDLGITYLQYELLNLGYKTIMLGPSIPIGALKPFLIPEKNIIFLSYFTVKPEEDKIQDYLHQIGSILLQNNNVQFYALGRQLQYVDRQNIHPQIELFEGMESLLEALSQMEKRLVS
ncbi:MAG: MerR family transcriptional regulator [Flavobacteriaceae bacterium]|nr:MerR family transcriptional regulator [Flavobacteriaceae bacterium]